MQFYAVNTAAGLVPSYDDDYDQKKRLTIGETYKIKVTKARNLQFHRKYFALIQIALGSTYQRAVNHFATSEQFRKNVRNRCGPLWKGLFNCPKGVAGSAQKHRIWWTGWNLTSYTKGVRHVIFTVFLKHISPEEFEKNLLNFWLWKQFLKEKKPEQPPGGPGGLSLRRK